MGLRLSLDRSLGCSRFAGAAINRGIKTIAIHDVDDPGIAVAAHLGCDVLAIPMTDNQLNQPTATVIDAVLSAPTEV